MNPALPPAPMHLLRGTVGAIVEDTGSTYDTLFRAASLMGVSTLHGFTSVYAALQHLDTGAWPDWWLLDFNLTLQSASLRMPPSWGAEVAIALHQRWQPPRTMPVIVSYSGESEVTIVEETNRLLIAHGIPITVAALYTGGFCKKPYPLTELYQRITRGLSLRAPVPTRNEGSL